jgi:hypothetical protein
MVERFIRGTGYRLKVSDERTVVSFTLVRSWQKNLGYGKMTKSKFRMSKNQFVQKVS